MLIPKLPMRQKAATRAFYTQYLGFTDVSAADYPEYLVLAKDGQELHFFLHRTLNPLENYGQLYIKVADVATVYEQVVAAGTPIHPNGTLETKPWGMTEFSVLDPDHNLITYGQEG